MNEWTQISLLPHTDGFLKMGVAVAGIGVRVGVGVKVGVGARVIVQVKCKWVTIQGCLKVRRMLCR